MESLPLELFGIKDRQLMIHSICRHNRSQVINKVLTCGCIIATHSLGYSSCIIFPAQEIKFHISWAGLRLILDFPHIIKSLKDSKTLALSKKNLENGQGHTATESHGTLKISPFATKCFWQNVCLFSFLATQRISFERAFSLQVAKYLPSSLASKAIQAPLWWHMPAVILRRIDTRWLGTTMCRSVQKLLLEFEWRAHTSSLNYRHLLTAQIGECFWNCEAITWAPLPRAVFCQILHSQWCYWAGA